jgi:hypothetical protein
MKPKFNLDFSKFNLLRRFNLKPKSAAYLMLATFFLVGGIYFIVVNVVATKGNEMGSLEKSSRDLQGENQRLEVEAARLKSLQVIDEGATGTVNVGNTTNTTTDSTTQPATPKIVTLKPKMVPSQHYTFLPSYTTLAQR